MSAGWSGAELPVLPRLRLSDRLRLVVRASIVGVMTLSLFGVYLLLDLFDQLRARLTANRSRRSLAPRIVTLWAWLVLPFLGLEMRRSGAPVLRRGVMVANHASWMDIVALQSVADVHFVAKAEVSQWPAIGLIGRSIGTVFIERRAIESQRQGDVIRQRLDEGDNLCIFPEGTSSDGRRVLPFRSALFGVFMDRNPPDELRIQPVTIRYGAPDGLPTGFYAWWGEMEFATHLRRVLAQSSGGHVSLHFHQPIDPADFSDRKSLAAACEARVRASLFLDRHPIDQT